MTKKYKLHQLTGTIKGCYPGQTSKKGSYKNQPFYVVEITSKSLFCSPSAETIYVFPNLVSEEIWQVLEQRNYKEKTYHFFCEKRVRGWRLKEWEEVK